MSQKRQPPAEEGSTSGEDGGSPDEKRQRVPALRGIFFEVLRTDSLKRLLSAMEPLVRRVVKEEVELALTNHLTCMSRECGNGIKPVCSRTLQLQFLNKLSLPIFTGTRIDGEGSPSITIALVDKATGERVVSGPESSTKVEIVVLEGDFEGDDQGNWTAEEFRSNVVKERDGKRSLLMGDVFVDLADGIAVSGELSFTDNSSWTRSRKFRLGARIVAGHSDGVRVKEARTEAFMVKDHRGELYKKHYPPSLFDEVWRIEKIGKDGAFHKRLSSENINTVKDFLTLLATDAPRLRNVSLDLFRLSSALIMILFLFVYLPLLFVGTKMQILGNGMSARMWEVAVEHARSCALTNQAHLYYADDRRKSGVVFNVVGEVAGIVTDDLFVSVNSLSEAQKADAKLLAKQAVQKGGDLPSFDMDCAPGVSSQDPNSALTPGSYTLLDDIYSRYPSPVKAADEAALNFSHPIISSPDSFARDFGILTSQFEPAELGKDSFGENMQYFDLDLSYLSHTLGIESEAGLGSAVASFITGARWSPYAVWGILLLVLRWRFSIKKKVATKKTTYQKLYDII